VRRIATLPLALAVLAAGGATVALAGSATAGKPVTRAQADAFAQEVELRASDLPGSTSLKGAIFGREAVQYEALKCGLQGRPGVASVGAGELWLADSHARVGSLVVVAPSPHFAEAEITGLESRGGRRCLSRALGRALSFELHHESEHSHVVKATPIPIGSHVAGVHLAIHILAKLPPIEGAKPVARYENVDAAFFRVGPADIAFFALGPSRLAAGTEVHLIALLHRRAAAHAL
jgi:hypothetical protein